MTARPKTLREMLAEGPLALRSRGEIEQNAERDDAATVRWMEATRAEAQAGPRKPGRPAANESRQETKVRSLRLTVPVWAQIDEAAEALGCSANRFIEEAIFNRFSTLNPGTFLGTASQSWAAIPSMALNDSFEMRPRIVEFHPEIAA